MNRLLDVDAELDIPEAAAFEWLHVREIRLHKGLFEGTCMAEKELARNCRSTSKTPVLADKRNHYSSYPRFLDSLG